MTDMHTAREFRPVHEAIEVLQEKWTMHVACALLDGPLSFNELGRTVGGAIPPHSRCVWTASSSSVFSAAPCTHGCHHARRTSSRQPEWTCSG
jgi:hypothetical protein